MLCAENTKSVTRQFFGKNGKTVGLGIASYTNINPYEIPIMDDKEWILFDGFEDKFYVDKRVARLKNGIPNPKERPALKLPWSLEFEVTYIDNIYCTLENLRQAFAMGGTLGLGTFRPFFGRYELVKFVV